MMTVTENLMRSLIAMQVAALEWDGDTTTVQAEARQALTGLSEHLDRLDRYVLEMRKYTNRVRKAVKDDH